jgi:hypothetical protein
MPNALSTGVPEIGRSAYAQSCVQKQNNATVLAMPKSQKRQPNKKPFDANQTAFMAFFMYAFCIERNLREASNCKTFIIGAQEGTRTPTMLLAST